LKTPATGHNLGADLRLTEEDDSLMLRRHQWHVPFKCPNAGVRCILSFPRSTETRWLEKPPSPGTRIRDHGGHGYRAQVWIVDEVLRSGRDTYTVFCIGRSEYLDHLRNGAGFQPDLDAELLEAVRRMKSAIAEGRRRWTYRHYLP
jgi:hypothetical protein